jgi:tetratricopeptide (TPR) repeat protein
MGVDLGIEPVWQFIARASAAKDKGDYQEAEFYARKAVFADQSVGAAYVLLYEILEKLGKKEDVEKCLRMGLTASPGDVALTSMSAQHLIRNGRLDDAEEFIRSHRHDPDIAPIGSSSP